MKYLRILGCFICLSLLAQDARQMGLRERIEASPKLPFNGVPLAVQPPATGWESGFVSWVAVDGQGTIYELQRGDKADPVLVSDRAGKLLRSWGKGDYIPHIGRVYSLKLAGNVLWAGTQPPHQPTGSPGWLVEFDRKTGKILGHLDVPEARGLHSVEQMPSGEPLTTMGNQLLWFKAK